MGWRTAPRQSRRRKRTGVIIADPPSLAGPRRRRTARNGQPATPPTEEITSEHEHHSAAARPQPRRLHMTATAVTCHGVPHQAGERSGDIRAWAKDQGIRGQRPRGASPPAWLSGWKPPPRDADGARIHARSEPIPRCAALAASRTSDRCRPRSHMPNSACCVRACLCADPHVHSQPLRATRKPRRSATQHRHSHPGHADR